MPPPPLPSRLPSPTSLCLSFCFSAHIGRIAMCTQRYCINFYSIDIYPYSAFSFKLQTLEDFKKTMTMLMMKNKIKEEKPMVSLVFQRISLHRSVYRTCLSVYLHQITCSTYNMCSMLSAVESIKNGKCEIF